MMPSVVVARPSRRGLSKRGVHLEPPDGRKPPKEIGAEVGLRGVQKELELDVLRLSPWRFIKHRFFAQES